MKRLLAVILCLSLLLGSVTVLAETKGAETTTRTDVTDTEAPEIISYTFREKGKTLKPGSVLHIQVKMADRSEIYDCEVYFRNIKADYSIYVPLYYNPSTDQFEGEYTLQKSDPNGEYVLAEIRGTDEFGNYGYTYKDSGLCKFKLTGAGKTASLKATVKIKENGKTVKAEEPIHVEITFKEKYAQATYLEIEFNREGTDYTYWYGLDYSPSTKKYTREIIFEKGMLNAKYNLVSVSLYGENGHIVGQKKITGQGVTLTGASNDKTPPKISSVTLKEKKKTLTAGDTVHISAKVKDSSAFRYVQAILWPEDAKSYFDDETNAHKYRSAYGRVANLTYNKSSKKWESSYTLPEDWPDGKYYISVEASDTASNYTWKNYPKLYFTYTSDDFVDEGIRDFIYEGWITFMCIDPTEAEIEQYGMPLVTGKQKAVNVIKTLVTKSGLSGEAIAEPLVYFMHGNASEADISKTVTALKTGLDYAIDSLNNAKFRQRCRIWGINPGNLGTKAADTQVATVDTNGGHYILNGSKATLTGVTDKNITSLVIPDTVSANGKTYKVTKIEGTACRSLSKLASVTIGKNVTSIGQDAFSGCKNLKTITINTTKLKTVGANAFANINSKPTFKCPKKQLKKYKKLIQKNAPKKAKFK